MKQESESGAATYPTMSTKNTPEAIAYAGLPGSGKTEAAEIAREMVGGQVVRMGDCIRQFYRDDTDGEVSSHALGEYATKFRKEKGPAGVARRMVLGWREAPPKRPVHIDGLRCVEEIEVFSEYFDGFTVIFIEADEKTRFYRLQSRGREGEDTFQFTDLLRRDAREYGWGVADVRADPITTRIENDGTFRGLENRLAQHVYHVLDFE